MTNSPELTQRLLGIKTELDIQTNLQQKIRSNPPAQSPLSNSNSILQQQLQNDSLNNNNVNTPPPNTSINLTQTADLTATSSSSSSINKLHHNFLLHMTSAPTSSSKNSDFFKSSPPRHSGQNSNEFLDGGGGGGSGGGEICPYPTSPTSGGLTKMPQRRRVRRKATSSLDDQAEHLTEMSVRGLDLFRYASITEGVYQCTECAKDNVQKTFKNKYSFQRHAFLYHEGKHRKVFPCPVCGKEFSRPDKMKNHMKTTHECYIPKEVNYHPLNYLITAAAAGDIQQMFPQAENISSLPAAPTGTTVKVEKHQFKTENAIILSDDIIKPPPTSASDTTISKKEPEEVK